ncbi:hypothetical protein BCR42DRAFT_353065 [Absidia repens]|uniref:Uncharacterized protein n=1 Tax=Absidia repens TaxID=90262 RepID=A0A1X2IE72_9FUNG|nr:hypothetical protein BCR42DRAFT_353065 [Absidia repens]
MIRWRTLNKGDSIDEEDNAEIQVEHLLEAFQTALKIHQRGQRVDAKAKYELILDNDVMTEEDTEEQTKGDALHSSSLVLLRFLVFKNYAAIIEEESKLPSCSKDERDTLLEKAMDYYIKALMIDPSERSLWHRIGLIAASLGNLRLARSSFEKGLYSDPTNQPTQTSRQSISIAGLTTGQKDGNKAHLVFSNGNISPIQWRCMEGLCDILYKIGDYDLCSIYLKSGLQRFPSWSFGKCLNTKIEISASTTTDDISHLSPSQDNIVDSQHSQPIIMNIATPNWGSLIAALLEQYKQTYNKKKTDTGNLPNQKMDVEDGYLLVNRAVQIHIDSVDDSATNNAQDTEMTDVETNANEKMDIDTSTPIEHQAQQEISSTIHNDTDNIINSTDSIQIGTLPTTEALAPENQPPDDKEKQQTQSELSQDISCTMVTTVDNRGTLHHFYENSSLHDSTGDPSTSTSLPVAPQQNDQQADINKGSVIDLTMDDNDHDATDVLKRKRDNQDDGDDEDEDEQEHEHEHEDKRTSLRASKRQKEKEESEEVSKKKMMAEENELDKKAQDVFDSFGNMNGLCRSTPWFQPVALGTDVSVLEAFWEYFDVKVSELGAHFTWNFENLKAKDDLFVPTSSKKHQYAKFETAVSSSSLPSASPESTAIRQFIDSLNETNSGAADSLCQTVIAVLRRDLHQTGAMDEDTTNLTIDAAETLGQELLSRILYSDYQDLWMEPTIYAEQIQLLVSLSEKLVDRLISAIRTEQSTSAGPTLSSKQRTLVEKQNKLIKQYQERCKFWIDLIGNSVTQDAMNSFSPSFLTDNVDQRIKKKKLFLRYWLLKGKLVLCENDVDKAMDWYKKCERLFENNSDGELNMTLACTYDAVVNLSAIQRKIQLLEWDKYFVAAKSKLDDDDYTGALSQLEALMSIQNKSESNTNMHDTFPMTTMLAMCYMKTERYLDAWKCYTDVLIALVSELVSYGSDCMMNNCVPSKGDDLEFFRLLCSIDTIIDALICLLLETKCQDWLPKSLDSQFVDSLMIILRTTILYTFRHPDFIPLVNNFSNPDMTPHVPSKKTKINSYNAVATKSWVMISTLAQHKMKQENSDDKLAPLANLLQTMHDELGEREVCGASKGIFLQHLVELLSRVAVDEHRRGIYQCYHCLYGVHLVAESELIEEHHAVHGTLDSKAAEHLYSLVIDDVLVKIDRNLPLKNDLKDAIETVSALFEDLPEDNHYIQRNRDIIQNYLERPVNIDQPIKSMLQQCDLPIDITHKSLSSLSLVFGHMFFIRGKTLRQHIKNRPKVSSDRTMVDLEEAMEQFKYHVILHPDDHQGWYELGSTLMQLAEEELTWSAVNIITHRDLIIDYQKQAFHSFMKTWQLSSYGNRLKKEQLFGFFTSFGSLIYGMTCSPMEMASFGWNQPLKTLDKSGSLHDVQPKKPVPALPYRLSLEFFSRALNYKCQDHSEWRTLYAIGKCFKKLERPTKEVLDWYIKSIRQCQDAGSTGNALLEPTYKLYATLLKYLYRGMIEPSDVTFYLNQASSMHSADQPPTTTTSTAPMPLSRAAEDSNSMTGIVDLTTDDDASQLQQKPKPIGKMEAFDLIFDKLTELRKRDKKHVCHRPVYKIAWMHYKIYNDAQKAKTEILQLFTVKQTNKGLVNIWRPDHERPGKHFVFIRQYVTFLIDLAKETNDLDILKNMCRKLKRAGTTLLKEEEGFKAALSAYIKVLQTETLLPHQGSAKRQQIITGPLDKDEFDKICKNMTNDLISSADANPTTVTVLQDLVDIRRQALGYVSMDGLDAAIQECFAILLFERTKVQSLLPQELMTTSTAATAPSIIPSPQTLSTSATQNTTGDVNQTNDTHSKEESSSTPTTTVYNTKDDDHPATTTDGNEPMEQDTADETGIEGSVLSLRARALVSALFSNGRTQ